MEYIKSIVPHIKDKNINAKVIFILAIYIVVILKISTLEQLDDNIFFGAYSISVSFYILSRFVISYFHLHRESMFDKSYEPTLTFGIPSKNEEGNIRETIVRIAKIDYPKNKFNIIVVNDGSTDNTLDEMLEGKRTAAAMGVKVEVIDWKKNRGKREGMAICIKNSVNDLIVFIDSDSFIDPHTPKHLVKYFVNKKVGAVAGHAYVANAEKNVVTKMQAVRYYVAFKAYKASESFFGSVTCCSGCCSAYRREYLNKIIDAWLNQEFLGARCTYGDDRSLTNYILKSGYTTLYSEKATAYTFVPDTYKKFMNQQLRWKKSWIRESLIAGSFMWKRHPIMSLSYYLGVILPLLSPIVVFRALMWRPYTTGDVPVNYILGLSAMAIIYGLYYHIHMHDKRWIYGSLFAVFYTLVLIWQLPYALLTIRDTKWGTR